MHIQFESANPVGEAFTTKKGASMRRWLLVSGRDCLSLLASISWSPKLQKTPEGPIGVCDVTGIRSEKGMSFGFIRENR